MPITYQYKQIFIHIPKCAGTSVEKVLDMSATRNFYAKKRIYKMDRFSVSKDNFSDQEYELCTAKCPQHLTFAELKKALPSDVFESFPKFSIVRNPFDRFISELKYLTERIDSTTTIQSLLSDLDLPEIDRVKKYDGHLETASSYLKNLSGEIDSSIKIYKYENIDECFSDLAKISPISAKPQALKSADLSSFKSFYTEEIAAKIINFYSEDFVNFDYSVDSWRTIL